MPNVNLAPLDAQQAAILRKRQLAQTLQQMSLQPIDAPSVPGAAISPWQGAAKLAQALVAVYKNKKLDKEQAALSAQEDAQRQTQAQGLASALAGPAQRSTVNLPTPQPQMMAPSEGDGYVQSNPTPQSSPMALPPNAQQSAQHQQLIAALGQGIASKDPNIVDFTKSLATDLLQGRRSDQEAMQAMERLQAGQQGENQRQLAGFGQQTKLQNSQQGFEREQQASTQGFAQKQLEAQQGFAQKQQAGEQQFQDVEASKAQQVAMQEGAANRAARTAEGVADRKNAWDIANLRASESGDKLPDLQYLLDSTTNGNRYIDASKVEPKSLNQLQQTAGKVGLKVVDKDTAAGLKEADTVRANQQTMMGLIESKLPKDAAGRILKGPANTLEKMAQSDPALASMGTFSAAAIAALRAVAGSKNFRMTQTELNNAIQNFVPQASDTLDTARQKLKNLNDFMDNKERVIFGSIPKKAGGMDLKSMSTDDIMKALMNP